MRLGNEEVERCWAHEQANTILPAGINLAGRSFTKILTKKGLPRDSEAAERIARAAIVHSPVGVRERARMREWSSAANKSSRTDAYQADAAVVCRLEAGKLSSLGLLREGFRALTLFDTPFDCQSRGHVH